MKFEKTTIDGICILKPDLYPDGRGFFYESYQRDKYRNAGIVDEFVQDNLSRSNAGVLRGLHYQLKKPQAQIVTLITGKIFDVVVDLRITSKTFGKWIGVELCESGMNQIYMPPGCAHGYLVLSQSAVLHYKVSRFYDPGDEAGLFWNDPNINITWPNLDPKISDRDACYPRLEQIMKDKLPLV